MVKAILCAGLYQNYAQRISENSTGGSASLTKEYWSDGRSQVSIHPMSVNHMGTPSSAFLVYPEKVRTSKVYIRDSTPVSALHVLLFSRELKINHETGQVS